LPVTMATLPRLPVYDVCVVGAGMIGSAAARHASSSLGTKVCLIGPTEPKVKSHIGLLHFCTVALSCHLLVDLST
jgi:2-polyprenyl-6-methoxyphenol hydroxylase-like FAD-dependent oxidoreductase